MDEKLKSENMQKEQFWEQSGQADVENGAMLTTYLFRYTSEYTSFRSQIFQKNSSPEAARGHWPPNQNPADAFVWGEGRRREEEGVASWLLGDGRDGLWFQSLTSCDVLLY